jgi:CRISPR-associated endonuclease/helicase Cas3
MFLLFLSDKFPGDVCLPTGTGKTSIMALWLLALAESSSVDMRQTAIPRRLVWVVNRRVVVDQATEEAVRLRERLGDASIMELEPVRCALRKVSVANSDEILGISTLRGQFEDNAEWRSDPSRPAIIVGTVDMIGSRLLFSGYGVGFKAKPLHAGFLGQDVLLIHDEAHLEHPFQSLLTDIGNEQKRCNEFGRLHVMALSATLRKGGDVFKLTEQERCPPDEIPDPPEKPIEVLWCRQKAKKTVHLHDDQGKLADEIAAQASKFKDAQCAVLVFVQTVEDVKKICAKLPEDQTQKLTGTLRGFERDRLVSEDAIFRRFVSKAESPGNTVYLVCTSAGEVGVNISADHLVCDLSTFESMVQRFGRVNRFGIRKDTEVHIFCPTKFKEGNELDDRREKTLALIKELPDRQASPEAIGELDRDKCLAAFAPPPVILPTSDILFDSWALTTIKGRLPGRPPAAPYLHGLSSEPPETHVAWRDEVDVITGELLEQFKPKDLVEDYPLKPHELLRDRSDRVSKQLSTLSERHPEAPVWLLTDDGSVEVFTLRNLPRDKNGGPIEDRMVILPPSAGGLRNGLLDGDSDAADDVADVWRGMPRRSRVWEDGSGPTEQIKKMRLIRTIDTAPGTDDGLEDGEAASLRYWHWYELPKWADNDGSKSSARSVLWDVHTADVVTNAIRIVGQLPLSDELRSAIVVAARFHDLGKRRSLFQRILGNADSNLLLAKSGKKKQPYSLNESYRHEFGSLLDVQREEVCEESEFRKLCEDMKEVVLHLIAAHHGRGRPHFSTEEAYDPEATDEQNSIVAAQVPRRFARLQRKYGRWGLAYLESLLRAADYAASANPSAIWEGKQ